MNKKLFALLFMTAAVYSVSFIPRYILGSVPKADYTYPTVQNYQESVTANGEISSVKKAESYLAVPVIPAEVYVSVGDKVEKNQILAEIDLEQTQNALINSIRVTQTLSSVQQEDISGLEALMQAYGLSDGNGIVQALSQQMPKLTMLHQTKQEIVPRYITAPVSGTVTAINLQEGVLAVHSVQPTAVVADTSQYKAVIEINESDVAKVAVGNRAIIKGSGFSGKEYEGIVSKIHPSAVRKVRGLGGVESSGVMVEILLENADGSLKDGFSVSAEIFVGDAKQVMSIPYEAIEQDSDNNEYVYVFQKGRAVKKKIATGIEMTYFTEAEGLTPTDKVLLNPSVLTENSRVLLHRQITAAQESLP